MTQGIEARVEAAPVGAPRTSVRARLEAHRLWLCGGRVVTVAAAAFLLHQLMAWPPHEDETLALFVGRDSLPGVIEHVTRDRGGAPLHFLLAWAVAHLGFGLGALRLLSAFFALASLPLVASLGLRLAGARVALVATVLVASSWLLLFHGVYGRMYSLFLFGSLACTLALLEALQHGGRGRWALWVAAALLVVATHPYGVLLLGGQAVYVLLAAARPSARGDARGWRRPRLRHPVLAHRPRPRRPLRRRGGRRRREARWPVGGCAIPLALRRGRDGRLVAGDASPSSSRLPQVSSSCGARRARSSSRSSGSPSSRSSWPSSGDRRRPSPGT